MSAAIDREATLAAARKVLDNPDASRTRRAWAQDVVAWLERGDAAAAQRLGATP